MVNPERKDRMTPLVSIITPTMSSRIGLLDRCHACVQAQDYPHLEWLIEGDALAEPRLTIGEKRNRLVARAKGDIIVHFDDDDYYGPTYVRGMVHALTEADLISLRGWYLYDLRSGFFGYWDLDAAGFTRSHFGFSFAYRKHVSARCQFPHQDWDEDGEFMREAARHFRMLGIHDYGRCLHILHEGSSSSCFPQYRLPLDELAQKFPDVIDLPRGSQ